MKSLALAFAAALSAAQAARPVTLVSEVRAALAAHDQARAETIVNARRTERGDTPETIEAMSWLARGAQADGQLDRADRLAGDTQRLAVAALGKRRVDDDAQLAT